MESKTLMAMSPTEMTNRINSARFPQELTLADKKVLAMAAITYGFDPLMGEISIYQGRPYISIDGRYRKAQETGLLAGVRTTPTTQKERELWQIPDGDFFFKSEVYIRNSNIPFVGYGRVRAAEINTSGKFKPVDVNPQRMAEKRAEAQALRKAFHIPLPSIEVKGTEDDENTPMVNYDTGEIIEDKPEPPLDKEKAEEDIRTLYDDTPAPQKPTPAAPPATKKPARDPATVDTMQKFWAACYADFNLMKAGVMAKLGYSSINDCTTPEADYAKLQKAMGESK